MTTMTQPFVTPRIREMIRTYALHPERFFTDQSVNTLHLQKLITDHISIDTAIRGGYACIQDTRNAVCDIVCDTWHLGNPRKYLLENQYGPVTEQVFDAAYAFLILNPDKVFSDFRQCFGEPPIQIFN